LGASKIRVSEENVERTDKPVTARRRRRGFWLEAGGGVLLIALLGVMVTAEYVVHHAEPILKASVVETLSAKFHSPVELDGLSISLARGVEVRGSGLQMMYLAGPSQPGLAQLQGRPPVPMLRVDHFSFHVSLHDLVHLNIRIASVTAQGIEIHIPPHSAGGLLTADDPQTPAKAPRFKLSVGRFECRDATLFIETSKPGKDPLEFDIRSIELTKIEEDEPVLYTADVINPKPKGDVRAFGHIGPWVSTDPRATPIDGHYIFDHADLSTTKGITGMLSSTGDFSGQFGHIAIEGTTSTPDFALDVSNHPVPLFTSFHAFVDGTTGDTTLTNVQAKLLHSEFTTAGTIVRVHGKGHDISLTVDMPNGHMEDVLELGMKTEPPVMRGSLTMKAKIHIPPGPVRVAQKMQIVGELHINNVEFTNAKLQDRVDALSMRAQGRPGQVKAVGSDHRPEVASQMAVSFSIANAMLTASSLQYQMPGAKVLMSGAYSLDGSIFEFKGHVRTDATASQMLTGWKSTLVKPFNGLLKKHGAGVELPVAVSGVKSDVKFGLAFSGSNESAKDMAADVKAKRAMRSR
jgi:hypothetical protein